MQPASIESLRQDRTSRRTSRAGGGLSLWHQLDTFVVKGPTVRACQSLRASTQLGSSRLARALNPQSQLQSQDKSSGGLSSTPYSVIPGFLPISRPLHNRLRKKREVPFSEYLLLRTRSTSTQIYLHVHVLILGLREQGHSRPTKSLCRQSRVVCAIIPRTE